MAGSVNKVILIGRLGRDPELRYTPNGAAVCTFSIATDESYTDREGQKVERTEWHNIVMYQKLGELAHQYLKKGGQVYIEGSIRTREYTDKENIKRKSFEIIGNEMTLLGSKPRDDDSGHAEGDYGKVYGSRPSSGPTGPRSEPSSGSGAPRGGRQPNTGPQSNTNAPEIEDDLPF
jgi:single-strand DNA-binding protein